MALQDICKGNMQKEFIHQNSGYFFSWKFTTWTTVLVVFGGYLMTQKDKKCAIKAVLERFERIVHVKDDRVENVGCLCSAITEVNVEVVEQVIQQRPLVCVTVLKIRLDCDTCSHTVSHRIAVAYISFHTRFRTPPFPSITGECCNC